VDVRDLLRADGASELAHRLGITLELVHQRGVSIAVGNQLQAR
jgi:hypothetical protein